MNIFEIDVKMSHRKITFVINLKNRNFVDSNAIGESNILSIDIDSSKHCSINLLSTIVDFFEVRPNTTQFFYK